MTQANPCPQKADDQGEGREPAPTIRGRGSRGGGLDFQLGVAGLQEPGPRRLLVTSGNCMGQDCTLTCQEST